MEIILKTRTSIKTRVYFMKKGKITKANL